VALLLSACEQKSSEGPISAHEAGKGVARVYDATLDQTWQAVHVALKWADAGKAEDHPAVSGESYVITNPDTSQDAYNAQVGVWLAPMNPVKTRVSVVVLGADTAQGVPNEEGVQKDIERAVAMIRAGEPIPAKRP
jgi:hypothetical protein